MASSLNFQPLIDAHSELARAKAQEGQINTRNIERGLSVAAKGIEAAGEKGRARKKEFNSLFDADMNKLANKTTRNYLTNRYNQIKQNGVAAFRENKNFLGYGKLTPEQQIELDDQLDSFKREAGLMNEINVQIDSAQKLKAKRPGAIKFNQEANDRYLELLKPNENGEYDVDGMAEFLSKTRKSATGQPFTSYADFDAEQYVKSGNKVIKEGLELRPTTQSITTEKNGKKEIKLYQTDSYGTLEERQNALYNLWDNSKNWDQINYSVGEQLTEDERTEAISQFGRTKAPYSAYYAYNKADLNTGFEETKFLKSEKSAPLSEDKPSSKKRGLTNMLDLDGKEIKTQLGVTSNNFVDYSGQPTSVRALNSFILPDSAEEIIKGEKPSKGKFGAKNIKSTSPLRQSAKGIGTPKDYEIVGHDKENGEFWLVDRTGRKQETESGPDWKSSKKTEYLDHIITVPEADVISVFGVDYTPQESPEKIEKKKQITW